MEAKIEISMDNAAFEDFHKGVELARILRELATKVENGSIEQALMDANGNRCGTFWIEAN